MAACAACVAALTVALAAQGHAGKDIRPLDAQLTERLRDAGFTGRVESTLTLRLGRPIDKQLADLGRLLWFDTITGLNGDNSCAGCHSPTNGFGDTQPIAIGIGNNGVVGPDRTGPRNERRAPMIINSAFFPRLMWNSRFSSLSGDPFDNSRGFLFPAPEGTTLSHEPQLLVAQAFIPPTERTEVAGFDFPGDNDAIRAEVVRRLDAIPAYRELFARSFPAVTRADPITYEMLAAAIAEFEFSLTFADAPVDRYARGDIDAMSAAQKRGALVFFGEGRCVACHSVAGDSNEMFSDFREHDIGVPQLVPRVTNNQFDGPTANEDFGREDFTGNPADRYAFRTTPLRNIALQPAFMHDGAFTSLEAAIRHHLDAVASANGYNPAAQGLDADLTDPTGPVDPILARLDPILATPIVLDDRQLSDLLAFVRDALLDPRARSANLRKLVPAHVPSGRPTLTFQYGPSAR